MKSGSAQWLWSTRLTRRRRPSARASGGSRAPGRHPAPAPRRAQAPTAARRLPPDMHHSLRLTVVLLLVLQSCRIGRHWPPTSTSSESNARRCSTSSSSPGLPRGRQGDRPLRGEGLLRCHRRDRGRRREDRPPPRQWRSRAEGPCPFAGNSKVQAVVWDARTIRAGTSSDRTACSCASPWLEAAVRANLFWDPRKRTSNGWGGAGRDHRPRRARRGYVYDTGVFDHLPPLRPCGNYIRTIYPFAADE